MYWVFTAVQVFLELQGAGGGVWVAALVAGSVGSGV